MINLRKIYNRTEKQEKTKDNQDRTVSSLVIHKRKKKIRFIILLAVVLIISGGFAIYRNTVKYNDYKELKSLSIDDGAGSQYVPYKEFFIKYGLDGASYVNGDEVIWNQAYEMSNPMVDVCEGYAAVADKGTNKIYVFDETGIQGEITTSYPIIRIEVANQGVVAALLEENTANYIEVYDRNGEALISHKTLLNGNGYPLGFSLSNDGTKMIVSYICINTGTMESKVLFYNFSDVGQNEVDRMVGGFNHYEATVIPTVKFLTNNTAIALGDNILSIYKMKEKPSLQNEVKLEGEIKKIFYDENHVGLVFESSDAKSKYNIKVYNLKGNNVMDYNTNMEFDTIKFSGKNIMVYDDMNCKIVSFNGKERFDYRFKQTIVDIIPTDNFREYLIISNNTVKRIKIK